MVELTKAGLLLVLYFINLHFYHPEGTLLFPDSLIVDIIYWFLFWKII